MAGLGVLVDMGVSFHDKYSFNSRSCVSTRTNRCNVGSHKYARYLILIYQMAITLLLRQSNLMSWKGADSQGSLPPHNGSYEGQDLCYMSHRTKLVLYRIFAGGIRLQSFFVSLGE
jgi:hypothetical protein